MPPQPLLDALQRVWACLRECSSEGSIAGGLAVAYWGVPRSTQDIDIALAMADEPKLRDCLRRNGFLRKEAKRSSKLSFVEVQHWRLPIFDGALDIEVDLLVSSSEYQLQALARATQGTIADLPEQFRILSCEDLILFKAKASRLIDLADIESLIATNQASMDWSYLNEWSAKLGVSLARYQQDH